MQARIAIKRAIDAVVSARLQSIPGLGEIKSEAPGDPSRFPALNQTASRLMVDNYSEVGTSRYAYYFSIEGNVDGDSGAEAENARDALYLAMINQLPPDPEIFGSGLVDEFEEIETRFGVATLTARRSLSFVTEFVVKFPADVGNPSTII